MTLTPLTSLTYVRGIGPQRAKLLKDALGLETVQDILWYFPSHYLDKSNFRKISEFASEMPRVLVRGRFISFSQQGEGAKRRLVALFSDGSGVMEVLWFKKIEAITKIYLPGKEYTLFGKPEFFNGHWSMVHPEVDDMATVTEQGGTRGIYPLTQQLSQRGITSRLLSLAISAIINQNIAFEDRLPQDVVQEMKFPEVNQALKWVHFPADAAKLKQARERFKFEELFYIQLAMLRNARERKIRVAGARFDHIGHFFNTFYSDFLPFPLTGAQKRVIREIRADMNTGRQMNRLLQGDVGSGKTLVALMSMLIAIDNGAQAALMAPTEILAQQHFETLRSQAAAMGVNIALLTGSTPAKERKRIGQELLSGALHILIGTHALLEPWVKFKNLGLAIIDEQHRFGVVQRSKLWAKNPLPPHVLVMTATPIPRTLAMTVYGDLDVSVIDEMPPGRKPVKTLLRYEDKRFETYQGIGRELRKGRQAYIVYPLVNENEKLDLLSLEKGYEDVCEAFHGVTVAWVHGQMKPQEKEWQMQRFVSGEARILVATTVIEVGVNVPNASVMLIENAERFGLSQLHQLRGRVGRGADQSYCILNTKYKIGKETRERLKLMTQTTDGFEIAEADMRFRGPGDISGTQQSGIPFNLTIANLATDGRIIQAARDAADRLLDRDPYFLEPVHSIIPQRLRDLHSDRDWGRIS